MMHAAKECDVDYIHGYGAFGYESSFKSIGFILNEKEIHYLQVWFSKSVVALEMKYLAHWLRTLVTSHIQPELCTLFLYNTIILTFLMYNVWTLLNGNLQPFRWSGSYYCSEVMKLVCSDYSEVIMFTFYTNSCRCSIGKRGRLRVMRLLSTGYATDSDTS